MESSAINRSLFVLAQCVDAINKKQARIPYRESKMTRILSLGQNNGLTVMILNLAPTRAYHLDTLSSLNFASRTKKIEVCEVENDPVYRTMAKPLAATASLGGTNLARQPLRPLTAAHNANKQDIDRKTQGIKPIKAFSVYSDTRKPAPRTSNLAIQNQGLRRTEAHKRPAEPNSVTSRPPKMYRSTDHTSRVRSTDAGLTKESIEALISQRIDEKLAEKALQDAAVAAPALSAELQRRLDDLEHRIDARDDDEKGQGLQFLLMAKQHTMRGEDASALRMYQLALPFFPGNKKLKAKMESLEDRIRNRKEAAMNSSNVMAPLKAEKKPKARVYKDESDNDDFAPEPDSDYDSCASNSSFKYRKATRKPKKTARKLPIFRDGAAGPDDLEQARLGEQTPRTAHLLKIINSRDVRQIRSLKGVGAKKADAIVNSLFEMDDEEVHDLEELAGRLKGIGGKTVEAMRTGISIEF